MEWKPFNINKLIKLRNNRVVCFVYSEENDQYISFNINRITTGKENEYYIYTNLFRDDLLEEPINSKLVGVCRSQAYHLWSIQQSSLDKISIGPRTKEEIEKCIKDRTIVYGFVKGVSTITIIQGIINQIDSLGKDFDFLLVDDVDEFEAKRWSLPIDRIFYTKKSVLSEIERTWK
jgi:hypothetical protein